MRPDKAENERVIVKLKIYEFISGIIADQMVTEIRMRVTAGKKRRFSVRRQFVVFLQILSGRTKYRASISSG